MGCSHGYPINNIASNKCNQVAGGLLPEYMKLSYALTPGQNLIFFCYFDIQKMDESWNKLYYCPENTWGQTNEHTIIVMNLLIP